MFPQCLNNRTISFKHNSELPCPINNALYNAQTKSPGLRFSRQAPETSPL